jgi:hypothetical protein
MEGVLLAALVLLSHRVANERPSSAGSDIADGRCGGFDNNNSQLPFAAVLRFFLSGVSSK